MVIGVMLDLNTQSLAFAVDGHWTESINISGLLECLGQSGVLLPAVSGANCAVSLTFNCGDRPFKHAPASVSGFAASCAGDYPALAAARAGHGDAFTALLPGHLSNQSEVAVRDAATGRSLAHFLAALGAAAGPPPAF